MSNLPENYYLRNVYDQLCAEYDWISVEERINKLRYIYDTDDSIFGSVLRHMKWMEEHHKSTSELELIGGLTRIIDELLKRDQIIRQAKS